MVTVAKRKTPSARHQLGPLFAEPDLVDRIFDYLVEQFPEIQSAPDRVEKLARTMRDELGGEQYYIPSRAPTARQQQVEEVLRMFNGRNATEIARCLQISRATVYRVIKQAGR